MKDLLQSYHNIGTFKNLVVPTIHRPSQDHHNIKKMLPELEDKENQTNKNRSTKN